jgi:hypothetical protein
MPKTKFITFITVERTVQAGIAPTLETWESLRVHPLLTPSVAAAQWAERHLSAIQHNITTTFADPANKGVLRADLDTKTGYHVFRVQNVPSIDELAEFFALSTTDVATNLRAALDKLAWQLAVRLAGGGEPPDPFGVHFPITDCLDGCDRAFVKETRSKRQIDGTSWDRFESFQPYHRTGGWLDSWDGPYVHPLTLIRDFSNDHKHRLTQPVLLVPNMFDFPEPVEISERPNPPFGDRLDWEFPDTRPELKIDAEVVRIRLGGAPEPHIDHAAEFTPEVSLPEGRTAIHTLDRLKSFVQLILSEFARHLP